MLSDFHSQIGQLEMPQRSLSKIDDSIIEDEMEDEMEPWGKITLAAKGSFGCNFILNMEAPYCNRNGAQI